VGRRQSLEQQQATLQIANFIPVAQLVGMRKGCQPQHGRDNYDRGQ
jgi:hypothetical protein